MTLPPLDAARARHLVSRFAAVRVLVVGDVMLDRFIVGTVSRISPEAPVPVVSFRREHTRLGGAANVAHNVAALGGQVSLVGVVGQDAGAARLRADLDAVGVGAGALEVDRDRPTTEKVRVVTDRNQQVARIDYEIDVEIGGEVEQRLLRKLERLAGETDVILVSDYLKGTITRSIMTAVTRRERGPAVLVDPKIPHLDLYAGATLVTPNHHEAEIATHRRIRTDEDAAEAAREFRSRAGCDAALITRGEQGMWLSGRDVEGAIPAVAREVSDVTGAGDTVVATLALGLAAGATLAEAAWLANHAAGVVVGKFGPATVSRDELLTRLGVDG
jgi:rfaE bifunctional protein kinase chain/domain